VAVGEAEGGWDAGDDLDLGEAAGSTPESTDDAAGHAGAGVRPAPGAERAAAEPALDAPALAQAAPDGDHAAGPGAGASFAAAPDGAPAQADARGAGGAARPAPADGAAGDADAARGGAGDGGARVGAGAGATSNGTLHDAPGAGSETGTDAEPRSAEAASRSLARSEQPAAAPDRPGERAGPEPAAGPASEAAPDPAAAPRRDAGGGRGGPARDAHRDGASSAAPAAVADGPEAAAPGGAHARNGRGGMPGAGAGPAPEPARPYAAAGSEGGEPGPGAGPAARDPGEASGGRADSAGAESTASTNHREAAAPLEADGDSAPRTGAPGAGCCGSASWWCVRSWPLPAFEKRLLHQPSAGVPGREPALMCAHKSISTWKTTGACGKAAGWRAGVVMV